MAKHSVCHLPRTSESSTTLSGTHLFKASQGQQESKAVVLVFLLSFFLFLTVTRAGGFQTSWPVGTHVSDEGLQVLLYTLDTFPMRIRSWAISGFTLSWPGSVAIGKHSSLPPAEYPGFGRHFLDTARFPTGDVVVERRFINRAVNRRGSLTLFSR